MTPPPVAGLLDPLTRDGALIGLVDGEPSGLLVVLFAVLVAFGTGAGHALAPGHGKALMAAYLAGTRGRPRDAVALGGLVAAMHTGSVLVVGLLVYTTQYTLGGERLDAALSLVAGGAVTAVGAVLLRRRVTARRQRRRARAALATASRPTSGHTGHHHGPGEPHGHGHGHGHRHGPLADGAGTLSRPGLVALAASGGLLPSPSAVLVLAASMAVGRTGFGLALVAAFGLGLATTLTLVGLAVVHGQQGLRRRTRHRSVRRLSEAVPALGATVLVVGGLVLAGTSVARW